MLMSAHYEMENQEMHWGGHESRLLLLRKQTCSRQAAVAHDGAIAWQITVSAEKKLLPSSFFYFSYVQLAPPVYHNYHFKSLMSPPTVTKEAHSTTFCHVLCYADLWWWNLWQLWYPVWKVITAFMWKVQNYEPTNKYQWILEFPSALQCFLSLFHYFIFVFQPVISLVQSHCTRGITSLQRLTKHPLYTTFLAWQIHISMCFISAGWFLTSLLHWLNIVCCCCIHSWFLMVYFADVQEETFDNFFFSEFLVFCVTHINEIKLHFNHQWSI